MTNFADPDVDGSVVSDSQAPATKSLELDQKDRLACLLREAVAQKKLATIVIFEGAGVAGILHTIQRMCQTLDPRHYYVHHFPEPVKHRPVLFLREYWQKLPLMGDLAIYDGSYYHNWIAAELAAKKSQKKAEKKYRAGLIEEIKNFERTLADNGYLILKVRVARREKDLKKDLKKDRSSIIRC